MEKHETAPEAEDRNEEQFAAIGRLIDEDGWRLKGNFFQPDQTYHIVLSKEGENDKVFTVTKPYPKIAAADGRTIEIP